MLAAALLVVAHGTAIGAQPSNTTPEMPGHFLTKRAVPIASARRGCLELGDSTYTPTFVRSARASARLQASLGIAGGTRWYSSLASRRWLFNDPPKGRRIRSSSRSWFSSVRSATRSYARVALSFRARGGPLGHAPSRRRERRSTRFYRRMRERHRRLQPELSLRRGGAWRNVRLSFLDSLNRRFPGAINHGYHVDVRTLRASAAVYSADDANCCPSRVAEMRLRLRADALEIIELRIRSNN